LARKTHLWRVVNVADHSPLAPLFVPVLGNLLDPAASPCPAFAVRLILVVKVAGPLSVVDQDVVRLGEHSLHDLCRTLEEFEKLWRLQHGLLLLLGQIPHGVSLFLLNFLARFGRFEVQCCPQLFLDLSPDVRSDSLEFVLPILVRVIASGMVSRRLPLAVCLGSFLVADGLALFRARF
jgi:hypothetical protein